MLHSIKVQICLFYKNILILHTMFTIIFLVFQWFTKKFTEQRTEQEKQNNNKINNNDKDYIVSSW